MGFARGKGFLATLRCQTAFRIGVAACCIGLTTVCQDQVGWDIVVVAVTLVCVVLYINTTTQSLLFRNASIINYWRPELGGKPDDDDPYDLTVPLDCFQQRVASETMPRRASGAESTKSSNMMVSPCTS